jgi:hypothetical protein
MTSSFSYLVQISVPILNCISYQKCNRRKKEFSFRASSEGIFIANVFHMMLVMKQRVTIKIFT